MSESKTIFTISDLHLGGKPGEHGASGFQICPEVNRKRVAEFLQWVAGEQNAERRTHLVINGDLVDFLAEEEFSPFTGKDVEARDKLQSIMDHSPEVWKGLKQTASAGVHITILLGNHDIEMSLPAARDLLLETIGSGRVEFLYDNQALAIGPVLIEHGNRYDRWNYVSHDRLREVRTKLSRREEPPDMQVPPGSRLVATVMNQLKTSFGFIDLLKPENEGVLPLVAFLSPKSFAEARKLAPLYDEAAQAEFASDGAPLDPSYWASAAGSSQTAWRLAGQLASGGAESEYGIAGDVKDFIERWKAAGTEYLQWKELQLLYRALNHFAAAHHNAFHVNRELETYLAPVRAAAQRGFEVVLFGHTHLVKRMRVSSRKGAPPDILYLNTGAWADLMALPASVLNGDEQQGIAALKSFADDLRTNSLDRWRSQAPTFARIELDNNRLRSADVYFFDGPGNVTRVPDGPLDRLTL